MHPRFAGYHHDKQEVEVECQGCPGEAKEPRAEPRQDFKYLYGSKASTVMWAIYLIVTPWWQGYVPAAIDPNRTGVSPPLVLDGHTERRVNLAFNSS
jgi:hypothetical protein